MVRGSKGKTRMMIKAFAVLFRNTTWKCGHVERLVVNYLRRQRKIGRVHIPVMEILQFFKLKGTRKSLFEAVMRLEKRNIIKVKRF